MGILQAVILEWISMLSSRGSSQPRDRTQVSHIAGRFFLVWAPTHTYCIIHSSLRGHLGCVQIFAVVDNAPVNIGVHISSQISVFLSFGFVCISLSVVFDSLWPHGLWPARFSCLWDSPGKSTGVDCHSLLQRNFPTQGSNPCLLHHRQILPFELQGSPLDKYPEVE